jgi:hypothetical protein
MTDQTPKCEAWNPDGGGVCQREKGHPGFHRDQRACEWWPSPVSPAPQGDEPEVVDSQPLRQCLKFAGALLKGEPHPEALDMARGYIRKAQTYATADAAALRAAREEIARLEGKLAENNEDFRLIEESTIAAAKDYNRACADRDAALQRAEQAEQAHQQLRAAAEQALQCIGAMHDSEVVNTRETWPAIQGLRRALSPQEPTA